MRELNAVELNKVTGASDIDITKQLKQIPEIATSVSGDGNKKSVTTTGFKFKA